MIPKFPLRALLDFLQLIAPHVDDPTLPTDFNLYSHKDVLFVLEKLSELVPEESQPVARMHIRDLKEIWL